MHRRERKQRFQVLLRLAQCLILYFGNINLAISCCSSCCFCSRCSIKSLPQKWWPRQSQSRSPEAELEVEVEAEDKGMQRNVRPNSTTMCGGVPPLPYDALGTSVVATPCRWSTKHVARIQIQIQQQQQQLRILLTTPCRVCYQIVCKSVSFRLKRKKKSKNINIK